MTPLLDTLFLLLFALLSAEHDEDSATEREETVNIRLPRVEAGEPADDAVVPVTLWVEGDGTLTIATEGSPTKSVESIASLDETLGDLLDEKLPEELPIEIRGDRDARLGRILELLQHLRLRGFVHIELLAEKQSDEPTLRP